MRIVELRFENLNSLVGHWQIDLEQAEFVSDGIFAITGPTGAGKTTILDAICLALYGSTPRLGRLGKGTNELMSRQTGQCFAQVTFETRTGRYISQWSQHRARKKPDGDLQAPRHEISDASSGKILSSSVKESAALIVELAGMSFEQFTRSMMLAQGAFAAFLQARSDERAPILEQITGSEIYSEISMLVHQYRNEQESRLQSLQQRLDQRALLSDEQRAQLQQQFETLQVQVQTLQAQQNGTRSALLLKQQFDTNAKQLQHHAAKQQIFQQHLTAFEPDRQRLLLARRTLEAAPDLRALELARQEQQADQLSLQAYEQQQPASLQTLTQTQQALATCQTQWQQQRDEFERMQPVLEKTRELDAQLGQQRLTLQTLSTNAAQAHEILQRLQTELQRLSQQRIQATQTVSDVTQQMQSCHGDATLPESLSGLLQALDAWVDVDEQHTQTAHVQQNQQSRLEHVQRLAEQQKTRWQATTQRHQQRQALAEQCQQALAACLQGSRLADWQQRYRQLLERKQRCQQAIENWQQMSTLTETIAADRQVSRDLQNRTRQLDLTIQQLSLEVTLRQEHTEGLRQQQTLQQRIQTYEQARAHLQTGQPCPLCGALEHPFAQGTSGSVDHLQQQINASEQALSRLERVLAEQRLERGQLIYQQDALEQRQPAQQLALQACQTAQPALLDELGVTLIPVHQTLGDVLTQLHVELQAQSQQTQTLLEQASHHASALQVALQAQQEAAQALQEQQSQWYLAQQQCDQVTQQVAQAQNTLAQYQRQRMLLTEKLTTQLSVYGVQASVFEQPAQVRSLKTLLTGRRDQWLQLQQSLQQAQQALPKLEQSIQYVQEQSQHQTEQRQRLQQTQEQVLQQIQQLEQQRHALLKSESPADVGRRLSVALEQARSAVDQARAQLSQTQMAHQQLLDRQTALHAALSKRAQGVSGLQETLNRWLEQHGFESEQALQNAMLSDAQRQALETRERQYLDEKSVLDAEKSALLREQAHLSASVAVEQSIEVLQQQLLDVEQRCHQATELLGSLRQRLLDDDNARRDSEQEWHQVRQQQAELEKWRALHSLIGSADGKKFRTFAQGLTFEVVIQHANRQLQRMSDRYVLVRGAVDPLELNVIDQYQAGEVRTTKNLSGGESFLVSLALALGLSNMASRKIRVDSLFLDEGFGTLDEEALDLALQALATLHQEGKLIGVISHVQALKDRLATQIQVWPTRGGRSVLQGPGCTQLVSASA